MENMIEVEKVNLFVGILLAVSILVIAAIMLDLWDGVHTARKTNERIHSHKLRVTIEKVSEYCRFLFIGFLVDCMGVLFGFYALPYICILFGVGLILIEAKSMFEHAKRRKSHVCDIPDMIKAVIECTHEHDAYRIVEMISAGNTRKEEENGKD